MSHEYVLKPFTPEIRLNIDYPRELNEQQLAAVTAPPGPALVIAGAGSGKTRTLTYRVAYLLEQGIPADRILLLTFTNKAAGEMMRRIGDLLGQELRSLWGGTFHSIGARVLRLHADRVERSEVGAALDRVRREEAEADLRADVAQGGQCVARVVAHVRRRPDRRRDDHGLRIDELTGERRTDDDDREWIAGLLRV